MFFRIWTTLVFIAVLGAVVLVTQLGARAYTYTYTPMPHLSITYSCGFPEAAAAMADWAAVSPLEDGGCTDINPDIEYKVIDPWPYTDRGGQTRNLGSGRKIIEVRPEYRGSLTVARHEFGHALGLGHSLDTGAVMFWNPCNRVTGSAEPIDESRCNVINADDIAGINSLYGPTPTPTATATYSATHTPASNTPTATPTPAPTQIPTATPTKTAALPSISPTNQPTTTPQPTMAPRYRLFAPGLAR